MPTVTLPDGSTRSYDAPVTPAAVAADIGPGLAKAAMLAVVDGVEWDLTREIDSDSSLALVTAKDDAILATIRHDAAHVMAEAVLELYPETQVTIGPSIENGFYYDFHRETPFSEDDLAAIEARMHDIVDRDEEIIRNVWTRDEAVAFYKKNDEPFKIELVEAIPEGETVTFYRQGDFIDLCRGPHLPSTGRMGHAFKLMSVAGAYWRGDSNRPMLQRIYGTAWRTEKELNAYLHMLEEAEKRDHRKLGRQLNFFHLQEEVDRVDQLAVVLSLLDDFGVARFLALAQGVKPARPDRARFRGAALEVDKEPAWVSLRRDLGAAVLLERLWVEVGRDDRRVAVDLAPIAEAKVERKTGDDHEICFLERLATLVPELDVGEPPEQPTRAASEEGRDAQ